MSYQIFNSDDLIKLRKSLNVNTQKADHLFGLQEGTYHACEQGIRELTSHEDNLIKSTNFFDENGKCFLPNWIIVT